MYKAITTKYIGHSATRPARIVARCAAKQIYVPYDSGMSPGGNHIAAAHKLANFMQWSGDYHGGCLPDDRTYVFVVDDGAPQFHVVLDDENTRRPRK